MLPDQYKWLNEVGQLPKLVTEFIKIIGIRETAGTGNNPVIMNWAKILKIRDYIADSIAWCGLAMAWIVNQAGYEVITDPLWAKNWGKFGKKVTTPMLGDICTFDRKDPKTGKSIGGHVGLYIAEDDTAYHIGGGNTSDMVKIARLEKTRLVAAVRPIFKIGQPASVKRYFVQPTGSLSTNEA